MGRLQSPHIFTLPIKDCVTDKEVLFHNYYPPSLNFEMDLPYLFHVG